MTQDEKRNRLNELNNLLDGRTKLAPEQELPLLQEAMDLCEELELERAWYRFKALKERLNRNSLESRRAEIQQ